MVYEEHAAGFLTLGRSAEKSRCHFQHSLKHASPLGLQKGATGRAAGSEEKFTSDCKLNLYTAKTWASFTITPIHKQTAKGRLCIFCFKTMHILHNLNGCKVSGITRKSHKAK